ncbi:Acyl-CoA synthetase (AMP-forming)/AMP-acid ligase II [Shimia gijangensis]|uniref:Acyl-CoA synthetase (AMP-forming)/AMP-acid ligase II n=1 Tax=Shimia gijangensis TaxID=1470563 RepID=A0A1M6R9V0_9RHOB|nr:AMP-binding protein [Shimia gijangensis]SHK29259.1 Acyl-CoA synthetase (AMP-forming)/AMP-acid ligase II [Shimia gijangensis]
MPLGRVIEIHARQKPETLAVSQSDFSLTYGALHDLILRLDSALRDCPTRPRQGIDLPENGRVFAVTLGNSGSALPLLATALATGHAAQVMDPALPEARLAEMLKTLPPDVLFCLPTQGLLIDTAHALGIPAITDLSVFAQTTPANPLPYHPKHSFLIGYTSGTTSQPKAFARARRTWRISLDASRDAFGLGLTSHTLAPGPLAHGITLYALAETLDAGATFYSLPHFDTKAAAEFLKKTNRIVAVPTMLEALCGSRKGFGQVENVTTAGAKLSPALLGRLHHTFPSATIYEYYGASELGFVSLNRHLITGSWAPSQSVGRPFAHVDLSIRHGGHELPQGETGAIHIRADLAIDGYLSKATTTGFRRDQDWATVGDLGRIDQDGNLHLMGREGGMVITAGHNVYPQEVETAISSLSGVTGAVVFGVPDAMRGQRLIAVVSGSISRDALRMHLKDILPNYKIPRHFYNIDAWPYTGSGKIARATLLTWLQQKDARLVPITA